MAFLKDCWYCAGWSDSVTNQPSEIVICGEELALYRDSRGEVVALGNRCPHRFAPLSKGKVINDLLRCPYHGLEFDCTGMCAANPHGKKIVPSNARVKSYPVLEKHGAVWLWFKDSKDPDPTLLPPYGFIEDPRYAVAKGYFKLKANYQLLNDNLLDLTHSAYIHPTTVGLPAHLAIKVEYKVRTEGNIIRSERFLPEVPPTPQFLDLFKDPVGDIYSYLSWYPPSLMLLDLSVVPEGTPKRSIENPDADALLIPGAHIIVPETEHTTHYFYAVSRTGAIHDERKTEAMKALSYQTFANEDTPMIEECYRLMEGQDFNALNPAIIESDRGGILARRILAKLISEQSHGPSPRGT